MSSSGYTEPGAGASAHLEEQNHDMDLAHRISEIFNDIPTMSEQEVADRHRAESLSTFDDENYHVERFRREYRPDEMMLPGFGEAYDGRDGHVPCGEPIPHVGDKCGHRADVGRTCTRSVCPRCGAAWVADRATNIVKNIYGSAKMKDGSQKLHHITVSPPPGLMIDSEDWYGSCMARIDDWMEEIDMDGIILPHPFSGDNGGEWKENHRDDQGEWKKRLFDGRNFHGDVRDELQHRPHFHVIGSAEWVPGGDVTDAIYNRTKPSEDAEHGWLIHRITRNGSTTSLGGIKNLARAVTYSLSHCAIDTTGEQNRYFHKKRGSAYHANDRHEGKARSAIHSVIGDTLGIDWREVGCYARTPADDATSSSVPTTAEDDRELEPTAADVDNLEADGEATAETDGMTSCHCSLTAVHKADFVEDPDWQQQAFHAEQALEAREEWDDADGFDRWIDEDDPPD